MVEIFVLIRVVLVEWLMTSACCSYGFYMHTTVFSTYELGMAVSILILLMVGLDRSLCYSIHDWNGTIS